MSGAAEQLLSLALSFDRAAGDETLPRQQRLAFARQANCFRILARLSAKEPGTHLRACELSGPLQTRDAGFTAFRLDLLLCHYRPEALSS
jgi:hypothetical protein